MTEELLVKAKEAQSPEELLTVMQENGMEDFTSEDAEALYAQLHTTGELTDEELENISGGKVIVGGQKYKVVTSLMKCFTGKWENGLVTNAFKTSPRRSDCESLRRLWAIGSDGLSTKPKCGTCIHLGFKGGTGYCEVEHNS